MESTVTLDWDQPQGSGPENAVENYTIYVSPNPPYQPATNVIPLPPWNITVSHNVVYTLNVTVTNCLGRSDAGIYSFSIGKRTKVHC